MLHSLLLIALSGGVTAATAAPPEAAPKIPPKIAAKIERDASGPRADEPAAAAAQMALKRRSRSGDASAYPERMRRARQARDQLPLHATRLGGMVPPPPLPGAALPIPRATLKALGTWESLGPGNIGGRSRSLVIQGDDPQIMYLGGVSGGVWKTVDGGAWWEPVSDELANIAVNSLVMDPDDPLTLYAGTGEGYFREEVRGTWLPLQGDGVFKTTDGGASWIQLESTRGPDFEWVNDLVISPQDSRRIYAATRNGVWRSDDGGASWARIHADAAKGGCLDLELRTDSSDDILFAACGTLDQGSVYRSLDAAGDGAWERVLSETGMGRTTLAIAPSDQDVIYALAAAHGGAFDMGLHAVFRSVSGGDAGSWQARVRNTDPDKLDTLLLTNPAAASYADCGWDTGNSWIHMGWYCNTIAVDPVDPDRVWVGGVDLFRSDDGGRNWGLASYWWLEPGDPGYVHADQHSIVFHPDYDGVTNRTIFSTNDGGIHRSDDALAAVATSQLGICYPNFSSVSWVSLNHNLGITQFYQGLPFPGGERFIGGTQDNGTINAFSSAGREGWFPLFGGDGGYTAVHPTNPNIIYLEYQWSRIFKSIDGGGSFSDARYGITDSPYSFLFITPFLMDPNDPQTLWMGGRRMWRTTNGAQSWQAGSAAVAGGNMVSAIAVSPFDSDTVVAGTTEGYIYRTANGRSSGSSTAWTAARPGRAYVSWLAFGPRDENTIWATSAEFGGPHVFRSTDGGASWEARDGEPPLALPDIPVHCIVVDPTLRGRLFVGTDLGVFVSSNWGRSWAVENTGFATAVTESLSLGSDATGNPVLYAFTHGRGAWRVPIAPGPPGPRRAGGRLAP